MSCTAVCLSAGDVRARELARQKREMLRQFMKDEQARRLEECQQAHERQVAEDRRVAEIAREKALKDEVFKAKKASDDNSRHLIRQQVQLLLLLLPCRPDTCYALYLFICKLTLHVTFARCLRGTVLERRSFAGKLSLSCNRLPADG